MSFVIVTRAPAAYGIENQQFIPNPNTCSGSEVRYCPFACPAPKKSPRGHCTEGVSSSSQYIRSTRPRKVNSASSVVIQRCLMQPGPSISPSVTVSPGGTSQKSLFAPVRFQDEW